MKTVVIGMTLAAGLLTACASGDGQYSYSWQKEGATQADLQRDSFDCEATTRAAAASFSRGLQGAGEAQAFAGRCMISKGYALVSVGTVNGSRRPVTYSGGVAYDVDEGVICGKRGIAPAPMSAGQCVNGGGTVIRKGS